MAAQRKLILRKCTAPNNELFKKPYIKGTKIELTNFNVKDGQSILEPHFIIKSFDGMLAYNYCYWSDTERDYFIKDIILLPQGQVELVCEVDVLYSFRDAIMNLVVHEERATNGQSNLIADEQVPVMQNTIIKDIIPLEMNIGDEFTIEDNQQFVLTTYNPHHIWSDIGDTSGESGDVRDDKGYLWGVLTEAYKKKCWDIVDRAKKYMQYQQQQGNQDAEIEHSHKTSSIKLYGCYYTRKTDVRSFTGGYGNYFSYDHTKKFTPSRFDTAFLEEANAVPALQYSPNIVSNWIPQEVKDAGAAWNGWDCSMLTWRCVFFGANFNIMTPDSPTGTSCSPVSVEIACALLNYVVKKDLTDEHGQPYTDYRHAQIYLESEKDLLPGDVIISGNISSTSATGSYWLAGKKRDYAGPGPLGKHWDYYYKSHLTSEPRKATKEMMSAINADFMMFVNHARVVTSSSSYVESTGGYFDEYGKYVSGNGIVQTTITPIQATPPNNVSTLKATDPFLCNQTTNGNYYMIVLRPMLLKYYLDNGYTADSNNLSPLIKPVPNSGIPD